MLQELLPIALAILGVVLLWLLAWQAVRAVRGLLAWLVRALPQAPGRARAQTLHRLAHQRLPKSTEWVDKRADPHGFTGLPLTLMVLAAVYIASLLGGLIGELHEAEGLVKFDNAVNAALTPYRTDVLVATFAWITDLGGSSSLSAVAVVATGLLWVHGRGYLIAPLWISFLGSQITTYAGKFEFGRARPEFLTQVTAATPSFPSGHATGAMAVYGFLAYMLARDLPTVRQRFEVGYWALVLIAVIGFSRLFLSVHYTSDVAAGFLVGGFWLLVGFAVAEQLRGGRRAT